MDNVFLAGKSYAWKLCTVAALQMMLPIVAPAASSTDYYVQDGLVTHWDAINNTGTGTHDSSATTWKNLVPGGMDLTIRDAKWADGKALYNYYRGSVSDWSGYLAAHGPESIDYVTGEFAISNVNGFLEGDTGCMFVFSSGKSSRYCIIEPWKTGFFYSNNKDSAITVFTTNIKEYRTLSFDYSCTNAYVNGSAVRVDDKSTFNAAGGNGIANRVFLGCNTSSKSKTFTGKYYTIRLYNRSLEPEEVAWNALVDRVRFMGGEAGYRDTGTDIQSRLTVANVANGTVTVNGDVLSDDLDAWDNCDGETVDYAISVSPAEGYMFMGWTGDVGKIASSSDNMRSIIVKHGKEPISLTPLFAAVPVPAMAEPVHVITVSSGETTLTTAVDDGGNAIGPSGTIVKKGAGKLIIASNIISNFAGEIVIEAGCWSATVRSGLGTQDGGNVWVKDGATLSLYSDTGIASGTASAKITRKVYLAGNGNDGLGAMQGSSGVNSSTEVYHLFPKNVELLGDVLIRSSQKVNFDFGTVALNRHTLTLAPYGADWDYLAGTFENGEMAITNKTVSFMGSPSLNLDGGAENVVTFRNGGGFRGSGYGQAKSSSAEGAWTAVFENGSKFYAYQPGSGIGWHGPIVLKGHTATQSQKAYGWINLWGPVSGEGDIGYNDGSSNTSYACLKLANADNSFTGGVWLKQRVLEATVDGAIPADGGALRAHNSTVNLSGAMEYHLPDFVISGTGSVHSASATTGSFKAAAKGGNDTYEWNTKVGAQSFALNGGVLKFGANAASGGAVVADFGCLSSVSNATFDLNGYALTCTNFTGTGEIKDGAFTLNGPWCATPAAGPLACTGTGALSFGENAVVLLADSASLKRARAYVLATSTETITSLPELDSDAKDKLWALVLSADGKSVILENHSGFTLIVY